jgi:hypothetical protein
MSAALFPHAEGELIAALGLAPKRVRGLRAGQLTRGTDWTHVGGQVRYSAAGRDKLRSLLKIDPEPLPTIEDLAPKKIEEDPLPNPPAAPAPFPAAAEPSPGDERELVCVKICMNKAIVLATFGDKRVRVRVRDSANITPGLKMKCLLIDADLWQLSQRLPRWRGKW